jgi:hypothetical protein
MPRLQTQIETLCFRYVKKYAHVFSITPKKTLFCNLCMKEIDCTRKSNVESHLKSQRHTKLNYSESNKSIQTRLTDSNPDITLQIVEAFLSADIPLKKLRNRKLISMFHSFQIPIPSETSARRQITRLGEMIIENLKAYFENKKVFVVADESEIGNKKYFNVLCGSIENPRKIFVIECIRLETNINALNVVVLIEDALERIQIPLECFVHF